MPGWIGPTVAISLVIIAIAFVAIAYTAVMVAREARETSGSLARELGEFRREFAPALEAVQQIGETGQHLIAATHVEVEKVLDTSRMVRHEVERSVRRARKRLDDFDALVEVMQEEVEDTALDVAVALRSVRASRSVLGRVGRLLARRPHPDDE
jgi:hypothetical protein